MFLKFEHNPLNNTKNIFRSILFLFKAFHIQYKLFPLSKGDICIYYIPHIPWIFKDISITFFNSRRIFIVYPAVEIIKEMKKKMDVKIGEVEEKINKDLKVRRKDFEDQIELDQ